MSFFLNLFIYFIVIANFFFQSDRLEPSFTDSVFRFRFRDSVSVSGFRVLVLPVSMKVKFCSRDTSHWFIFWSRALFGKPASRNTLHLLCRPMVRRGLATAQAISGDRAPRSYLWFHCSWIFQLIARIAFVLTAELPCYTFVSQQTVWKRIPLLMQWLVKRWEPLQIYDRELTVGPTDEAFAFVKISRIRNDAAQ